MDQDLIILLATSGMYYCLAVLKRDHPAFMDAPDSSVIDALIESRAEDVLDVGGNLEDIYTPVGQLRKKGNGLKESD